MARAQKFTLREWRLIRHKTIEQMAALMEVSPSTYSKWERRITSVKLGDLARILNILDVGPEQVLLLLNEGDLANAEEDRPNNH